MKMKAGFSLEDITVKRIDEMAIATHREKSTIVDMAVELLAQQDEFAQIDTPQSLPARKSRAKAPAQISGVRKGA